MDSTLMSRNATIIVDLFKNNPVITPVVKLAFPLVGTLVTRHGDDLSFQAPDGSSFKMSHFFSTHADCDYPCLSFPDAPDLSMDDFLDRLGIMPAAGDNWEARYTLVDSSHGMKNYEPGAELIAGIDHLDGLDAMADNGLDAFRRSFAFASSGDLEAGQGDDSGSQNTVPSMDLEHTSEDILLAATKLSGIMAFSEFPEASYTLAGGVESVNGQYGILRLDAEGNWVYEITDKNLINGMALGKSYEDTFSVIVRQPDGSSQEITVRVIIDGDNDAPMILQDSIVSDTGQELVDDLGMSGRITAADPDEGDTLGFLYGTPDLLLNGAAVALSAYGELILNDDGSWIFRPVNATQRANLLALDRDEQLVIRVPVRAEDIHGAQSNSDKALVITITGANQVPVFSATTLGNYDEDEVMGAVTPFTGSLVGVVSDADGDSLRFSTETATVRGIYGSFSIAEDGTWQYTPDPGLDINFMFKGGEYTETFTVIVEDDYGGRIEQEVTLTITGENDNPVIIGVRNNGESDLDAPGGVVQSGVIVATDPDSGDAPELYEEDSAGPVSAVIRDGLGTETVVNLNAYGRLVIDADGKWRFLAEDPAQVARLLALTSDETLVLTVPISVTDGYDGTTKGNITIEINGSNVDPAFDASSLRGSTTEDGLIATPLVGTLAVNNPDGDTLSYSVTESAGTYGTLSLNPATGRWTYTPTEDINFMAKGQSYTESFEVHVSDGRGGVDTQTLTITITGDNDVPVLTADSKTGSSEILAGGTALSGAVTGTDIDEGADSITYSQGTISITLNGSSVTLADYGEFELKSDGTWTFTAKSATQIANMAAMGRTDTLIIIAQAIGTDEDNGKGYDDITITVSGGNDAPVLADASAESTDSAMFGGTTLSGQIVGLDPDHDTIIYSGTPTASVGGTNVTLASYGNFVLNPNGSWTFAAQTQAQKNAMRSLGQGESLVITVPVSGTDGIDTDGSTLIITITGSSQGPDFTATTLLGETHEDTLMTARATGITGQLEATDPDGDDFDYEAGTQQGLYGSFTVDANGKWTYTLHPDADINFMAPGEDYIESFTVSVTDEYGVSTERTFTLHIAGDNDNPVIYGTSQGDLDLTTDTGDPVLSGVILASDPDEGDGAGNFRQSGPITATIDGDEVNLADYGNLVINPDGTWSLIADDPDQRTNLADLQDEGKTLVITVDVVTQDKHGGSDTETVTIEVNGDNNLPVPTPTSFQASTTEDDLIEDGPLSGTLAATDDAGESLSYILANDSQGEYGSLSLDSSTGKWTYTPTRDINFMVDGESYTENFTIQVSDGRGGMVSQNLVITIGGNNDAPVIEDARLEILDSELEEGQLYTGSIAVTDPDTGDPAHPDVADDPQFTPITAGDTADIVAKLGDGTEVSLDEYGDFTLDANGNWTFKAGTTAQQEKLQSLGDGDSLTITIDVSATDGEATDNTGSITVIIKGSDKDSGAVPNRDPVMGADLLFEEEEDLLLGKGSIGGQLSASDPDSGDELVYSVKPGTGESEYGIFTVTDDGRWSYVPADNLNNLAEGEELIETVTVLVSDGKGGTDEQVIKITITGDNDAPVLKDLAISSSDADLASGAQLAGVIEGTDVDRGDSIEYSADDIKATINGVTKNPNDYGKLVIDPDTGAWTFVAENETQRKNLLALDTDEKLIISATITGEDDTGATSDSTLTITVQGGDQSPSLTPDSDSATDAYMYAGNALSGQMLGTDPEGTVSFSVDTVVAKIGATTVNLDDYGFLTLNPDGNWRFKAYTQAQKDKMYALGEENLVITVTVEGSQGGATESTTLTITINGDDQPVTVEDASAEATDAAMAGGTVLFGTIGAFDPENGTVSFDYDPLDITETGAKAGLSWDDYGDLSFNPATGEWSFKANSQTQKDNMLALGEGDTLTITVPFTATDGGDDVSGQLTITIHGSNQGPSFDATTLLAERHEDDVILAGPGGISGSLLATDLDGDAIASFSTDGASGTTLQGRYGAFTLSAAGTWTYVPNQDLNFMVPGQQYTESFTVFVKDDSGAVTERTFTLNILGDNDVPVVSVAEYGPTDLNAADGVVLSGTMLGTDADAGDSVQKYWLGGDVTASIDGTVVDLDDYGKLVLNENGSWYFVAETPEQQANLRALGSKELKLGVNVAAEDSYGGVGYSDITLTLNQEPENSDVPVWDEDSLRKNVLEDTLIGDGKLQGTLIATDSDGVSYSLVGSGGGKYGVLVLLPDGNWTYTPTTDINFMIQDVGYTETFQVMVSDGKGGVETRTLAITITGENDSPVLGDVTLTASDMALYDGTKYSIRIPVMDADQGDTVTLSKGLATAMRGSSAVSAEAYGTFVQEADGTWTFSATTQAQKDALLSLAEGETLTITVPISAEDKEGDSDTGEVTITIVGTNQAPEFVSAALSKNTTEDALGSNPKLSGNLSATDVDTGDSLSYGLDAGAGAGRYGTLTVAADGTWTYTRTADLAFLESGETAVERFEVWVDDGHTRTKQVFTLNIAGEDSAANNAPILSNASEIATDKAMSDGTELNGTIVGTDADGGDIKFSKGKVIAMRGDEEVNLEDYGDLTLNEDGEWTFKANDPDQQDHMLSLAEGENLVIRVPVSGSDGTAEGDAWLTITVTGTNQNPTLIVVKPPTINEDAAPGDPSLSGRLSATDPDSGDELTYGVKDGEGKYGRLEVTDDGRWTYVPGEAINQLAENEEVEESFTVTVSDGHGGSHEQTITLTLHGENDAPVLDDVRVESSDWALGYGAELTGRITGMDPEGDFITFSSGDVMVKLDGAPANLTDYGELVINSDGTWSLQAKTPAQRDNLLALEEGKQLVISVVTKGSDGTDTGSGSLTITINGGDQPLDLLAVVTNPESIEVREDDMMSGGFAVRGTLGVEDPEGDSYTYTLTTPTGESSAELNVSPPATVTSIDGLYGTLTLQTDGSWTYTRYTDAGGKGMDLNGMAAGQEYTDTFTIYAKDANGHISEQELNFVISGDNDAPVIKGTTQGRISYDGLLGTVSGDLTGHILGLDVDEGDIVSNYHIVAGSSLVLEISGQRVDLSQLGDVLDGLLDFADPALNVVGGTLDAALDLLYNLLEGTQLTNLLTIQPDGSWTIASGLLGTLLLTLEEVTDVVRTVLGGLDDDVLDTVLESLPWLDFKADEDLLALKVLVEGEDNHGAPTGETEIGITILGGNNPPVFGADIEQEYTEDEMLDKHSVSDTLVATDGDDAVLTYSLGKNGGDGTYGTLQVNPDGSWTYTLLHGDKLNALAEGDPSVTETFTVLVQDEHGGYDEQQIIITLTGQNDAPVFEVETLHAILVEKDRPDSGPNAGMFTGQLKAVDPDNGAVLKYSLTGGIESPAGVYTKTNADGTFTLYADGAWTYSPSLASLQAMGPGDVWEPQFDVVVTDDKGASASQTLTVTVVGTDDVPQVNLSGDTEATEGEMMGAGLLSGSLTPASGGSYDYTLLGTEAVPGVVQGLYGTLSLDAAGNWVYERYTDMDLNSLAGDVEYKDNFTVLVTDSATGAVLEKQITITIQGENDDPVFGGNLQDQSSARNADNSIVSLTGRVLAADPDNGDRLIFTKTGAVLTLGGEALTTANLVDDILAAVPGVIRNIPGVGFLLGLLGLDDAIAQVVNALRPLLTTLLSGADGLLTPITDLLAGTLVDVGTDGEWALAAEDIAELLGLVDALANGLLDGVTGLLDEVLTGLLAPLLDELVGPLRDELTEVLPILSFDSGSSDSTLGLDVNVDIKDGNGGLDSGTISVTILGDLLNNAPQFTESTLEADASEADLEADRSTTGTLAATDDAVDMPGLSYALVTGEGQVWNGQGRYGNLVLNETTGVWTYTLLHDISGLAQGQRYVETFTVVVRDAGGGEDVKELHITITGENDAPVFERATLSPVLTENALSDEGFYVGQLRAYDPDSGAKLSYSIDGVSMANGVFTVMDTDGIFTLNPDGTWTYEFIGTMPPDNYLEITFNVVVSDGLGGEDEREFTLTLVGTNEAPDISAKVELREVPIHEDALQNPNFRTSGSLKAADPEDGAGAMTYALLDADGDPVTRVEGRYGALTLDSDGTWTYTRNPGMDFDFMAEGQDYKDSFIVRVTDAGSNSVDKKLTFNIIGDNDAPVITGVSDGLSNEAFLVDGILTLPEEMTGGILGFDPDQGDSLRNYNVIEGSLMLNIAGQPVDLDNLGDLLDGLLDGADPLLIAAGTLVDGLLDTLTTTLADAGGLGNLLEVDPETGNWTLLGGPLNDILGLLESLTDTLLGVLDLLTDDVLDDLLVALPWLDFKRGEDVISLKVQVEAEDSYGESTGPVEITIGLIGGNNPPAFEEASVSHSVTENDLLEDHHLTGQVGAVQDTDDDAADLKFFLGNDGHGDYGTLSVNPDGSWVYTVTSDKIGSLTGNASDSFTVMVADGHGGLASQTLEIVIEQGSGTTPAMAMVQSSIALPDAMQAEEHAQMAGVKRDSEPEAQEDPIADPKHEQANAQADMQANAQKVESPRYQDPPQEDPHAAYDSLPPLPAWVNDNILTQYLEPLDNAMDDLIALTMKVSLQGGG